MAGVPIPPWHRPLYLMIKPGPEDRARLIRLCAALGIETGYAPERWHSSFLPVGESSAGAITALHRALDGFDAAPFPIVFDHVEGDTLKPRKGQRAPGLFQRALAAWLTRRGIALPAYAFSLHLNLAYGSTALRRAAVAPITWTVDEILLIEVATDGMSRAAAGR